MHNRFELLLAHGSHVCHQLALSLCLKGLTGSISLMYHSKPTNEIIAKQLNEDEMISPFDELSCNSSGSTMNILPLPSLWDRKERKMLSSDPIIILQKINSDFNEIALYPQLDLYPSKNREVIDEITQKIIYEGVYDGAIACGEAKNQAEYDVALGESYPAFAMIIIEKPIDISLYLNYQINGQNHLIRFITYFRHDAISVTLIILHSQILLYLPS